MSLQELRHRMAGWFPHVRMERRLFRIQHLTVGNGATYVGNNRVLVRMIVDNHALAFYVHADDKLLSPWVIINAQYEPDVTRYIVSILTDSSHCIDVGSNFGYFTCLMAKFASNGKVVGLEPNTNVHHLAADNVFINHLHERSEVLNVAASDQNGEMTLFKRIGRSGNTSVAPCGDDFTRYMREPAEEAFQIPTLRIDNLMTRFDGRVDVMKIDVEGAEPLAFAGARETIAANPQLRIVMEWSPDQIRLAGFDVAHFVEAIRQTGLHPFTLAHGGLRSISHNELSTLPYQPAVVLGRPG